MHVHTKEVCTCTKCLQLHTLVHVHTKEVWPIVPWSSSCRAQGCTFHCSAKNVSVATHLCMPRWKIATIVIRTIRITVYATKTKLTVSKQCWGGPSTILSSLIYIFFFFFFFLMYVETLQCYTSNSCTIQKSWKAFLLFNCVFTVRTAGYLLYSSKIWFAL